MKIFLSGWTAAGKTTHARLLAAQTGWPCLHMSTIMRATIRHDRQTNHREWRPDDDTMRGNDPHIDRHVDNIMSGLIKDHPDVIVDAWLQPWLYQGSDALRLWIESDVRSRCAKAAVSHLRAGRRPHASLATEIAAKDDFSVRHFRQLYHMRFGYDHDVFDLRLDNSKYIERATIEDSDAGILKFHGALCRALTNEFGMRFKYDLPPDPPHGQAE